MYKIFNYGLWSGSLACVSDFGSCAGVQRGQWGGWGHGGNLSSKFSVAELNEKIRTLWFSFESGYLLHMHTHVGWGEEVWR